MSPLKDGAAGSLNVGDPPSGHQTVILSVLSRAGSVAGRDEDVILCRNAARAATRAGAGRVTDSYA
jgi:hypothetical protein